MSASKEKKIRKQQRSAADWVDTKAARQEQERKAQKRSNLIFGVVAVLFVAVAVVSVTWNSGILQKTAKAVTINGETYSPAQMQYYYINSYQSFVNENYDYLSFYGLDPSVNPKSQECFMMEDGTWYDYFVSEAASTMMEVQALTAAAEKDGYGWNDEMQKDYEEYMSITEESRANYNEANSSNLDLERYIQLVYGSLMTEEVYEEETRRTILVENYATDFSETLTYTDAEINDAYAADKKTYDLVSYNSLRVSGSAATKDAEGNTITPTEEDKAAAMADAKELANTLLAEYEAGAPLSDLAEEYKDSATLTSTETGSWSDTVLYNWLYDDARKEGDFALLEDTTGSSYYVVEFNGRYRHEYNTVNVRHILVPLGEGELTSSDAGYEEQQNLLKEASRGLAQSVLDEWQNGESTEESFAALADEHSVDTAAGGLYKQVYKGAMVQEFEDWCFDETRQPGDTGLVYSEAYGYHVMYFVGEDEPFWKVQVNSALMNADYSEWYQGVIADYTYEIHSFGASAVG